MKTKILITEGSETDAATTVPVFCPVCEQVMRTSADAETYQTPLKCCQMCELFWRPEIEQCGPDKFPDKLLNTDRWQNYLARRKRIGMLPVLTP